MKLQTLAIIAAFVLTLGFQTAKAQKAKAIPTQTASLVAHLVKEANQPDAHSAGDVYLSVTIGKIEYVAELASGKIVNQQSTESASGGFSGAYAEVGLRLLDKDKQDTSQGASQLLKLTGKTWKRVALAEGDYQCADLKTVPKATLKTLKIECN